MRPPGGKVGEMFTGVKIRWVYLLMSGCGGGLVVAVVRDQVFEQRVAVRILRAPPRHLVELLIPRGARRAAANGSAAGCGTVAHTRASSFCPRSSTAGSAHHARPPESPPARSLFMPSPPARRPDRSRSTSTPTDSTARRSAARGPRYRSRATGSCSSPARPASSPGCHSRHANGSFCRSTPPARHRLPPSVETSTRSIACSPAHANPRIGHRPQRRPSPGPPAP